jgi:hypothetical protein
VLVDRASHEFADEALHRAARLGVMDGGRRQRAAVAPDDEIRPDLVHFRHAAQLIQ